MNTYKYVVKLSLDVYIHPYKLKTRTIEDNFVKTFFYLTLKYSINLERLKSYKHSRKPFALIYENCVVPGHVFV